LALAVFTSTADATTVMRVFIDNATNANLTIALTASGPQVFFFPVPESATVGSVVGVQWFAGTSPGRATFSVLVGP